MLFTDPDRARISAAIAAAEQQTAGEIVVIVASERYRYPATCLSVAALLAMAVPVLVLVSGWSPASLFADWAADAASGAQLVEGLIVVQAAVFAVTLAATWFGDLGRRLTPSGLRHDRVHRAALTQFKARGMAATIGRTGVLLFIDEPEHIAEIVADSGIYAKVAPDHWADTIDALITGIKAGKPADGVVAAIGLAGDVLAAHFPPLADDTNELPDSLIEL